MEEGSSNTADRQIDNSMVGTLRRFGAPVSLRDNTVATLKKKPAPCAELRRVPSEEYVGGLKPAFLNPPSVR